MIPIDVVFLFAGVALALAMVPGPDNIFVLTQSALHGRLAGLIVTLGLATVLLFHTTAVAFGVAVLFQTFLANLFTLVEKRSKEDKCQML